MIQVSQRARSVQDSITLRVSAQAAAMRKAGVDVVGFGAGEPDFDTPQFIREAAKSALDAGQTRYTPTPCLPELRASIARKLQRENGLNYAPECVSTGAGGKHCLYMAFQAVLEPGDEVILPAPYWVSYPEQVRLAGGVVKVIPGQESNDFKITPRQLQEAITGRTRVLVINTPSNPAGHAYTPEELAELGKVVLAHPNLCVFSDEIYEKLVYQGLKFVSFAALHPDLFERTLTFNCHSKTFAMTGWRVGYVAGPRHVIDAINRLQSQMTSHITSFAQVPAAVALDDPKGAESVEIMRQAFEKRGEHMWRRLTRIPGISCVRPLGAFYCFPNISRWIGRERNGVRISDAVSFASLLLEQAHVAVVPGNDSGFPTHVRLSFATSMEQIDKGLDRIERFLREL
jgi:aspartate aminotransferase